MNFLLLVLLDISASDDVSPHLTIARKPLEALISDWLRQGEEIRSLRRLLPARPSTVLNRAGLCRRIIEKYTVM
jgi:hypothetical protein